MSFDRLSNDVAEFLLEYKAEPRRQEDAKTSTQAHRRKRKAPVVTLGDNGVPGETLHDGGKKKKAGDSSKVVRHLSPLQQRDNAPQEIQSANDLAARHNSPIDDAFLKESYNSTESESSSHEEVSSLDRLSLLTNLTDLCSGNLLAPMFMDESDELEDAPRPGLNKNKSSCESSSNRKANSKKKKKTAPSKSQSSSQSVPSHEPYVGGVTAEKTFPKDSRAKLKNNQSSSGQAQSVESSSSKIKKKSTSSNHSRSKDTQSPSKKKTKWPTKAALKDSSSLSLPKIKNTSTHPHKKSTKEKDATSVHNEVLSADDCGPLDFAANDKIVPQTSSSAAKQKNAGKSKSMNTGKKECHKAKQRNANTSLPSSIVKETLSDASYESIDESESLISEQSKTARLPKNRSKSTDSFKGQQQAISPAAENGKDIASKSSSEPKEKPKRIRYRPRPRLVPSCGVHADHSYNRALLSNTSDNNDTSIRSLSCEVDGEQTISREKRKLCRSAKKNIKITVPGLRLSTSCLSKEATEQYVVDFPASGTLSSPAQFNSISSDVDDANCQGQQSTSENVCTSSQSLVSSDESLVAAEISPSSGTMLTASVSASTLKTTLTSSASSSQRSLNSSDSSSTAAPSSSVASGAPEVISKTSLCESTSKKVSRSPVSSSASQTTSNMALSLHTLQQSRRGPLAPDLLSSANKENTPPEIDSSLVIETDSVLEPLGNGGNLQTPTCGNEVELEPSDETPRPATAHDDGIFMPDISTLSCDEEMSDDDTETETDLQDFGSFTPSILSDQESEENVPQSTGDANVIVDDTLPSQVIAATATSSQEVQTDIHAEDIMSFSNDTKPVALIKQQVMSPPLSQSPPGSKEASLLALQQLSVQLTNLESACNDIIASEPCYHFDQDQQDNESCREAVSTETSLATSMVRAENVNTSSQTDELSSNQLCSSCQRQVQDNTPQSQIWDTDANGRSQGNSSSKEPITNQSTSETQTDTVLPVCSLETKLCQTFMSCIKTVEKETQTTISFFETGSRGTQTVATLSRVRSVAVQVAPPSVPAEVPRQLKPPCTDNGSQTMLETCSSGSQSGPSLAELKSGFCQTDNGCLDTTSTEMQTDDNVFVSSEVQTDTVMVDKASISVQTGHDLILASLKDKQTSTEDLQITSSSANTSFSVVSPSSAETTAHGMSFQVMEVIGGPGSQHQDVRARISFESSAFGTNHSSPLSCDRYSCSRSQEMQELRSDNVLLKHEKAALSTENEKLKQQQKMLEKKLKKLQSTITAQRNLSMIIKCASDNILMMSSSPEFDCETNDSPMDHSILSND